MINFEKKLQDLKIQADDLGKSAARIKKMVELLRYQRDLAITKWWKDDPIMRAKAVEEFNKILEDNCK